MIVQFYPERIGYRVVMNIVIKYPKCGSTNPVGDYCSNYVINAMKSLSLNDNQFFSLLKITCPNCWKRFTESKNYRHPCIQL